MKKYLGIDVGGTAVKMGIIDENGNILKKETKSVSFDNYRTPMMDTIVVELKAMLKEYLPEKKGQRIWYSDYFEGIGVSATGQVDSVQGRIAGTCGNVPGWNGTRIKEILEMEFGLPVAVANDANCMCLGEKWIGAAAGVDDMIGITLGTGVGGGIVTGGRLLEGARGFGGEIGHFTTHALDGAACTCGQRGCYERYASTTALVRNAEKINPKWTNGYEIFQAVQAGNKQAKELLDQWIREISTGLIGLVHIFNPSMIVIGGGVSVQEELLIRPIEKQIREGVMPAFAEGLVVKAAQLKNDAGMIGAVYYFISCEERKRGK